MVNDLSLHNQFLDRVSFKNAIGRLMLIRSVARRFGREVYCHRNLANADAMLDMKMQQAISALSLNEQRAFRSWITQHGPFWDDARGHTEDDYFEWNDLVVTNTAVGEAAWLQSNGIDRQLISFTPSNWSFSPVMVDWKGDAIPKMNISVGNHWDSAAFEAHLQNVPLPLDSWGQLKELVRVRCSDLTFGADAFQPLHGQPFVSSAADRLLFILETLNRFKSCFDDNGQRTAEGQEIYQKFFTGKKGDGGRGALFTDSSDTEKVDFNKEMTFVHPDDSTKTIFCPWHGKVQTPQYRVHFTMPVRANEPLYIMHVGPKITKY